MPTYLAMLLRLFKSSTTASWPVSRCHHNDKRMNLDAKLYSVPVYIYNVVSPLPVSPQTVLFGQNHRQVTMAKNELWSALRIKQHNIDEASF